jgi:1-acyl-sn-glycerol-3-phosphate acyltransferase
MPSDESVFFFAEGTRTADGEIHPFKRGGIKMAFALGIPVVPVAIAGTREALPKGSGAVKPGKVRIAIGAPLLPGPESAESQEELLGQVEAEVRAMFERIRHLDRAISGGFLA